MSLTKPRFTTPILIAALLAGTLVLSGCYVHAGPHGHYRSYYGSHGKDFAGDRHGSHGHRPDRHHRHRGW